MEVGIAVEPYFRTLHLPFDAYRPNSADLVLTDRAADVLTKRCMAARRETWREITETDVGDVRYITHRRRYGLAEDEVARRVGYHLPQDPGVLFVRRLRAERDSALRPTARVAAYGKDGKGGCVKEALDYVNRFALTEDRAFVHRLGTQTFDSAWTRPAAERAVEQWSSCMAMAGFAYKGPGEAGIISRWGGPASKPTPQEIATATADVTCKKATNLVPILVRVESKLQEQVLRQEKEKFAAIAARIGQMRSRLTSIVQGSSSGVTL
ncbi:hypothetical protein [Nonomuraea sp. KM88]|uniref:hypothetical protein n=1 Tax=Nonomuraea sp. KM88 TaxID=3457427 RepID=UPI003FCE1316